MAIARDIYSVTVVVEDQDRALAFYRDVLGCAVRTDREALPGARLVGVTPPDSAVPIALLTREGGLPLGVRYRTADAERAHRELVAAGITPDSEVLHLEGWPPMFTVDDTEGNTIILMEDASSAAAGGSSVEAILACVPVTDLEAARGFYERLFGRGADAHPMPSLAQWEHNGGTLQVAVDERRSGGGMATILVPDLAREADELAARGLSLDISPGDAVTAFASIEDPDGNLITLVQAAPGAAQD